MDTNYVIINKKTLEIENNNNYIAIDRYLADTIIKLNKKGYYTTSYSRAHISRPFLAITILNELLSNNLITLNNEVKEVIKKTEFEETFILFKNNYEFKSLPKNFKIINGGDNCHLFYHLSIFKEDNDIKLKTLKELDDEFEDSIKELNTWVNNLPDILNTSIKNN